MIVVTAIGFPLFAWESLQLLSDQVRIMIVTIQNDDSWQRSIAANHYVGSNRMKAMVLALQDFQYVEFM